MRIYLAGFSALMIALFTSVAPASADCSRDCYSSYDSCFTSCSQCQCSQELQWCLDSCQYVDTDGDGVTDPSDNCPDNSNANQADCDEDGIGDVCDTRNEKWVFVQDLGRCDFDGDMHSTYFAAEQYGARRYRNVCGSNFCSDRYLIGRRTCSFSFSGCGQGSTHCCECHWQSSWCTIDNTCGGPDCPF